MTHNFSPRFRVIEDGANGYRPRFSRNFAVVDMNVRDESGWPVAVLETNSDVHARDYANELNAEARSHATPTTNR